MAKKLKRKVKNSKVDIKVKNEGLLEVPEGKKVNELPLKHFEDLVDKKGYDKVIKAINNLQVWNKNDDKKLSKWAEDTMKKLKKKFRPEEVKGSAKRKPVTKSLYKFLNPDFTGLLQYGREGHFENDRDNDLYAICEKRYWLNDKYPNSDKLKYTEIITDPARHRYVYRVENIYDTEGEFYEKPPKGIIEKSSNETEYRLIIECLDNKEHPEVEKILGDEDWYGEPNTDNYSYVLDSTDEDLLYNLLHAISKLNKGKPLFNSEVIELSSKKVNKSNKEFKIGDHVRFKDGYSGEYEINAIQYDDEEVPMYSMFNTETGEDLEYLAYAFELVSPDEFVEPKFEPNDKVYIKNYQGEIFTIDYYDARTETYKLKELGFSRYSEDELEAVEETSTSSKDSDWTWTIHTNPDFLDIDNCSMALFGTYDKDASKAMVIGFNDNHTGYFSEFYMNYPDKNKDNYYRIDVDNSSPELAYSEMESDSEFPFSPDFVIDSPSKEDFAKFREVVKEKYPHEVEIIEKRERDLYNNLSTKERLQKAMKKINKLMNTTSSVKLKKGTVYFLNQDMYYAPLEYVKQYVSEEDYNRLESKYRGTYKGEDYIVIPEGTRLLYTGHDQASDYFEILDGVEIPVAHFDPEDTMMIEEGLEYASKRRQISTKNSATEELTKVPSKTKVGKLLDSLFPSCDIEMKFPSKTVFDKDVIKENLDKNKKHKYLAQSSKKPSLEKIKQEIKSTCEKYFEEKWGDIDESFVEDSLEYTYIDVELQGSDTIKVEVRSELGYNGMSELADHLNKIVTKYDEEAYFEQVDSGIMDAYITLKKAPVGSSKRNKIRKNSKREKIENSTRYELFDKYDGSYCYTTYDASLVFDAQNEWDDAKEQGEYVAVPRPKTKEDAYEFFKSIYDIDEWTDEEWKKHCEEVGIENSSKTSTTIKYTFYIAPEDYKNYYNHGLDSVLVDLTDFADKDSIEIYEDEILNENDELDKYAIYLSFKLKNGTSDDHIIALDDIEVALEELGAYNIDMNETTIEDIENSSTWNSPEEGDWVEINKWSYEKKGKNFTLGLYFMASGWLAELIHNDGLRVRYVEKDPQEALDKVYEDVKDLEWAKSETFVAPITIKESSTERGKYAVTEMIGNYGKIVFKSDDFYEVQDYMADRWERYCEENNIDPSDEKESELFHSYFSINEVESSDIEKFIIVDYPYFVSKTGTVTTLKSKEFSELDYNAFLKRLLKSNYAYLFNSQEEAEKYKSKLTDSDDYEIVSTKKLITSGNIYKPEVGDFCTLNLYTSDPDLGEWLEKNPKPYYEIVSVEEDTESDPDDEGENHYFISIKDCPYTIWEEDVLKVYDKEPITLKNSASGWNWNFRKTRHGIELEGIKDKGTEEEQKLILGYDDRETPTGFFTEVTLYNMYDVDHHERVIGFADIADAVGSLEDWHKYDNTEHVLVEDFELPKDKIQKLHELINDIYFGDVTYKTHEEALDHEMKALQELDELEHGKIKKSTETSSKTFEDNLDLMTEFLQIKDVKDWDKFVSKHPSISDNDMDDTNAKITPEVLADLFRQAENAYLDEINDRETDLNVSAEEAKTAISNYVYNSGYLSKAEQDEFEDLCSAMGC